MKKLLLSLAAVIGLGSLAFAGNQTFTFSEGGYANGDEVKTVTSGDVTLTFDAGSNKNAPKYYTSGTAVRLYGGNTLTISVPEEYSITEVVFTISGSSNTLNSSSTVTEGTLSGLNSSSTVWTGSTSSFTLTQGGTSGHARIKSIEVTYGELSEDYVAAPTFSVKGGTYYGTQSVELKAGEGATIYYTVDGSEPTAESAVYSEAIEVAESATIKAIAVVDGNSSEVAEAEYVILVRGVANSIAELIELGAEDSTYEIVVNFDLTVGYAYSSAAFATDGKDFIQIYITNSYESGDVIPAGWFTTYTLYGSTPEIIPVGDAPEATSAVDFKAAEYALADVTTDLVNNVIVVKDVTFADAIVARTADNKAANYTGTNGDNSLVFRTNYYVDGAEAGTYDVLGVVTIYNSAAQVYPISFASATSSVSSIAVDSNAAVEYFNLQGVRVANPANGLFIRRQGNEVSKVLVR